jgi:hypothetical protein
VSTAQALLVILGVWIGVSLLLFLMLWAALWVEDHLGEYSLRRARRSGR